MDMKKQGSLIVLSGFSGTGKGTVVKELISHYGYQVSISATTRERREGEENGREYFFLTSEEFKSMIDHNQLIEWAEYVGNYYGTPKAYVEQELSSGRDVILEIEMQGALKVKQQYPDALMFFIAPPSAKEVEKRLIGRGTDSMDTIAQRLSRAAKETCYLKDYEYLVVNDSLTECRDMIHQIIRDRNGSGADSCRMANQQEFAAKLTEEMQVFLKGD